MSDAAPLRVLVVDDEEPARALLCELLAGEPEVVVVGTASNGFEAVRATADLHPDLLLLDVRMPKLDGFEVLELLSAPPAVVFVTAFEEHALRAFEVHAVDYLLKPVAVERLHEALVRARQRRGSAAPRGEDARAALLRELREADGPRDRIVVREGAAVTVIPVDQLDFVEAHDDYLILHTGGHSHRKQQTLQELAASLDPRRFVRIHRGILLNIDRLSRLEPYARDSRVAFLADGRRLPVSRAGYERLKALLG